MFTMCSRKYLIASIVYGNQWLINDILNVDSTGFVHLIILMMSLVML